MEVVGKTDLGLDVQIKPSNTHAFIPLAHLSDSYSNCPSLLEIYSPVPGGEVKCLNNVLFYGKDKQKSLVCCSLNMWYFQSQSVI